MTSSQRVLITRYVSNLVALEEGEAALLPALMRWLITTRWLGDQTQVAREVPWLGRRIDLALLNGRGIASAFELKIGSFQRVVEQAAYNKSSFHRSWIVTGNRPRPEGLRWASELGLGLLVVQGDTVLRLRNPTVGDPHPTVARRLRAAILRRASWN
jgi:hypothetical protein